MRCPTFSSIVLYSTRLLSTLDWVLGFVLVEPKRSLKGTEVEEVKEAKED
jgi:hypothetical protein